MDYLELRIKQEMMLKGHESGCWKLEELLEKQIKGVLRDGK